MSATITDARYPIGKYETQPYSDAVKTKWKRDLQFLPTDIEKAIQTFDKHQLDTPYREGGWTIQQLVHHIADSHMNAYIRFKLALTEDNPTIKPYEEADWAQLPDTFSVPVNVSVTLLHALHRRWVALVDGISEEQFLTRTVFHPATQKQITVWNLLGMYAWHSRHHLAHITTLKEQRGW